MNYLYIAESEVVAPNRARFSATRSQEAIDEHELFEGVTISVTVQNSGVGKGKCSLASGVLEVEFVIHRIAPARLPLGLIVGIPRPQSLKKVLLFSATIGARSLVLVGAEKAPKSYLQSAVLRSDSVNTLFRMGLEQGGDCRVPDFHVERSVCAAIENRLCAEYSQGARIIFDTKEDVSLLAGDSITTPVTLAVGPEAGWSDSERESLISAGFQSVNLGPRMLRVEQALMVGTGLILPQLLRNRLA